MGYDGVELACWGDHFEVSRALTEDNYVAELWEKLQANGLSLLCHLESPRRPSGLRLDRRAPPSHPLPQYLGRRRS
jgi:hypothetical protein